MNASAPFDPDPDPGPPADDVLPVSVAAALLGTRDPARLASFLGRPRAQVARAVEALASDGDDDDAHVLGWFADAPRRAPRDVEAAVAALAEAGEPARAARLAVRHGDRAAQRRLLREHGWTLLLSSGRDALDALMPAALAGTDLPDDGLHALHLAWLVEGARLPHEAERRWRERPLADAGLQALLESRCAQMYDDPEAASQLGAAAVAALPEGPHPAAALARFAHGVARLDAGRPDQAQASLAAALRAATRDGLAALQVDALHAMAWAYDEAGDEASAASCVTRALALARETGLEGLHAVDSARRLAALQSLRRQAWGATPDPAAMAAVRRGHPYPVRLLDAMRALLEGDVVQARALAATLAREALEAYQPRKWRLALAGLQSALAARAGDRDGLLAIAGDPSAARAAADPATASLLDLQAAVVAAGAARLAGLPLARDGLERLDDALAVRGLRRLQARLALARALDPAADAVEGCLAWCRHPAADPIDAVLLGPRAVDPLSRLALDPRLGADPSLAARVRALVRWLASTASEAARDDDDAPPGLRPPADLTEREWDVLRLIGRDLTNEQIALRLGVSVATVKTHINRAYGKLGLRSRGEAVQRARALEGR